MSQTRRPARQGRRTVARHGELSSPGPLAFVLKLVGVIAAVALVAGFGVAAYALSDLTSSFADDAVELEGQGTVPPDIGYFGPQSFFIGLSDRRLIKSMTFGSEPLASRHFWGIDNLTIAKKPRGPCF